jgi:hypothetical protein
LPLDLVLSQAVKIVRYRDFARQKSDATGRHRLVLGERHDLDQWLASLGNDEGLALGGTCDQTRQLRFGFVDVDDANGRSPDLVYKT